MVAGGKKSPRSKDVQVRTRLENEKMYVDRALRTGWRIGDIQLKVAGGKTIEIATKIFELYDQVLETSTRVDSGFNVVARVYYSNTQDLHALMEALKGMPHVMDVRFSEISAIIDRRTFTERNRKESPKL